ncbi:MAG: hypothetical protein ACREO3_01190, partial [Arenimonas sp.]
VDRRAMRVRDRAEAWRPDIGATATCGHCTRAPFGCVLTLRRDAHDVCGSIAAYGVGIRRAAVDAFALGA